ncbi:MAG: NAD-dependent protein deacylase [Firmicutes bacterium]|nr:NAD-dependent protein deacylase [Bacillota bacterium]
MSAEVEKLKEIIAGSNNIVFFGGAGVSTESGIPDFRSENGIYKAKTEYGFSPERLLSASFFKRKPEIFFDYYKKNLLFDNIEPNYAHKALADLEACGKLKAVVTQNIDDLHQKAGSKNVLELHGTLFRNYCIKCGKHFEMDYVLKTPGITRCDACEGIVRPDIVLYEEGLDNGVITRSIDFISNADVLIVGGTSLAVYPAAGLINYYYGNKLVLINRDATPYDKRANLIIRESIGQVFKEVMGY